MRLFGKASDFYRLRIITLEEEPRIDFDWDEEILYRSQPSSAPEERQPSPKTRLHYIVQLVKFDSEEAITLKKFNKKEEALRYKTRVEESLTQETKSEFDSRFLNQRG